MRWVLFVEDDPLVARAALRYLARVPMDIRHAVGVNEALSLVDEHGHPGAVITDFRLKDSTNGATLIRALRDRAIDAPCVVWTGTVRATVDGALLGAGVREELLIFEKPELKGLTDWLVALTGSE